MIMPLKAGVDLDAILNELGHFGRYQVQTYCLLLLPIVFSAIYNGQYIFNAAAVPYRCKVPECESPPLSYEADWWSSFTLPSSDGHCRRLQPIGDTCTPAAFHVNDTVACSAWVYQSNFSIVSEFDLACEEWKRTLVGTMHSVGLLAALPLTGYVSDTFGRRTAFVLTATCGAVMALVRSFSVSYYMYIAFEFLEPAVGSGVYSTGFIIALELVGQKWRVLGGNILSCFFALGQVTLALLARALPYWRTLTRVIYAPSLLFVFYYFLVQESVRWLLSKGRKEEAAKIIYKVAATNKKKLSPESIKQLSTNTPSEQAESPHPSKTRSLFKQVVHSRIIMTRLAICSFWWITVTFIYYGLSINSVSLVGDMYLNYMLTSLVEIPGYVLSVLTLDRFGRKSSIMTAFFICGVSLVALPFIPPSLQWLMTTLTMVGKLSISMTFSSIYIYTSELFPTSARHSLLGFCSMVGRIGTILAPQTPLMMRVMKSLPYLVFGVMAGTSGLLMLLTPETLSQRLPDTIAQAENIDRPDAEAPRTEPGPKVVRRGE